MINKRVNIYDACLGRMCISLNKNLEKSSIVLSLKKIPYRFSCVSSFSWSYRSILIKVRYFFKYLRVVGVHMAIKKKKLALKQAPPHHCVLCKKSLRELAVFKRFAVLFPPFRVKKSYWISSSIRSPKFFIVYSLILKMARFLCPLVVEAREPKSSEAMKLPTTIFLFVYLYAKFPWSFERAFEWILY